MTVSVDIADRQFDYTDEEKAADAVASFQEELGLNDDVVLALWKDDRDPRRAELENRIFKAVDANGTVKRAAETVAGGIELYIQTTDA